MTQVLVTLTVCVALSVLLPFPAEASHFRGGLITWKPSSNGDPKTITLSYRMSWRRGRAPCDETTIAAGTILQAGSLDCYNSGSGTCSPGCSGTMGTTGIRCTDYSVVEDWTTGVNSYDITFDSQGCFEMVFQSGDWIPLVYGGGVWSVLSRVDLSPRPDTGAINSSPLTAMVPIVRLQLGCNHTITIPVSDADGDYVRCRWAVGTDECGGICGGFPAAVLDERACLMHVSDTALSSTGYYGVAVQVEDFDSVTSTVALSTVPLQFLVEVISSPDGCHANAPIFVPDTPLDGACYGVPLGDTFRATLVAEVASPDRSITEITTLSPQGFSKSPVIPHPGHSKQYYVNVTWTPIATQQGPNIFCFYAADSVRLTSEQRCVTIVVGSEAIEPPSVVSVSPEGVVMPNTTTWSITFNKPFVRPHQSTLLHFVSEATGQSVHSLDVSTSQDVAYPTGENDTTVVIHANIPSVEGEYYYIVWDKGFATGTSACLEGAAAVTDPTFWRFLIAYPTTTTTIPTTTADPLDCSTCVFSHGVGYLVDPTNCQCYYRCQQFPDGTYLRYDNECCAAGLLWDGVALTCNWAASVTTSGCQMAAATPPPTAPTTSTTAAPQNLCPYPADPVDPSRYIVHIAQGNSVSMPCGAGLIWDEVACICDSGNGPPASGGCSDAFLLHYPFDDTVHDVSCQQAHSDVYGNPQLSWDAKKSKALQLDGQSRLTAEFLNNWFAGKDVDDWTVSLWFKSTSSGGVSGLVSNGNCDNHPGFGMHVDAAGVLNGFINTGSGSFQVQSGNQVALWTWNHAAIVYNGNTVVLYLNGAAVDSVPAQGSMLSPHCPLTLGHTGSSQSQGFLQGFMDEVLIYNEGLSASAIASLYSQP